jgi:hypothetical protein
MTYNKKGLSFIAFRRHFVILVGTIYLAQSQISAFAQEFKMGFQAGFGAYQMKGLKEINSGIIQNLPFKAKIISNYPNYLYSQPMVIFTYKNRSLGAVFSYHSSGSRISSKDYSGEYRFDSRINSWASGLYGDIAFLHNYKIFNVSVYSELGVLYTNHMLNEFLKINNQELINENYRFSSRNYYTELGFKTSLNYSVISIDFNFGYFLQFGKNVLKSDEGFTLRGLNGEVRPEWGGIRYGITFLIPFAVKKKD